MYLKNINGQLVPYTVMQLRQDNPNTSFPKNPSKALLSSYGLTSVTIAEEPPFNSEQVAEKNPEPTLQSDGTYVWDWTVRSKTQAELDAELIAERASMRCSPMQGKLALGEAVWTQVELFRDNGASWTERVIIDSALDWERNSVNIAFFQQMLGMTDEQVDNLFRLAKTF